MSFDSLTAGPPPWLMTTSSPAFTSRTSSTPSTSSTTQSGQYRTYTYSRTATGASGSLYTMAITATMRVPSSVSSEARGPKYSRGIIAVIVFLCLIPCIVLPWVLWCNWRLRRRRRGEIAASKRRAEEPPDPEAAAGVPDQPAMAQTSLAGASHGGAGYDTGVAAYRQTEGAGGSGSHYDAGGYGEAVAGPSNYAHAGPSGSSDPFGQAGPSGSSGAGPFTDSAQVGPPYGAGQVNTGGYDSGAMRALESVEQAGAHGTRAGKARA